MYLDLVIPAAPVNALQCHVCANTDACKDLDTADSGVTAIPGCLMCVKTVLNEAVTRGCITSSTQPVGCQTILEIETCYCDNDDLCNGANRLYKTTGNILVIVTMIIRLMCYLTT
ncbi:hypothetical protein MAR_007975 [Mya arenaria]|uniref:Uncharacterized protein n=1 Tax=Mya arenaria TaxID=6604 RepID=A0ABY7DUK8_MYAAR|nr:hypothetical protein MAR_007975 [Mya arenaria]